jgi:hypothetical protein
MLQKGTGYKSFDCTPKELRKTLLQILYALFSHCYLLQSR